MKYTCSFALLVALSLMAAEARPQSGNSVAASRGGKQAKKPAGRNPLAVPPECGVKNRKCIQRFVRLQKAILKEQEELARHGNKPVAELTAKAAKRVAKRTRKVEKQRVRFFAQTTPVPPSVEPPMTGVAPVDPAGPAVDPVVDPLVDPVVDPVVDPAAEITTLEPLEITTLEPTEPTTVEPV